MKKAMVLFLCILVSGCSIIEDGQNGVKHKLGKISDTPLKAGIHFYNPITQKIEKWNVKRKEIMETANVPSSEGLISTLDVSILFRYSDVALVRKTIGVTPIDTILKPYSRDAIRRVASGFKVKALYSDEGREKISLRIVIVTGKRLNI